MTWQLKVRLEVTAKMYRHPFLAGVDVLYYIFFSLLKRQARERQAGSDRNERM